MVDAVTVERIGDRDRSDYDAFVRSIPDALAYHGAPYRALLSGFLDAEPVYFAARDDRGGIVGVLPGFVSSPGTYGRVFNSLPFYGSNGGVVTLPERKDAGHQLLLAASDYARSIDCAACTIVASPFTADDVYVTSFEHDVTETRVGQVTELPEMDAAFSDRLAAQLHRHHARILQKVLRSPITVASEPGAESMAYIAAEHQQAIAAKQGLAKPPRFFELIAERCEYGRDYETFIARVDGQPIAGLLLFYFNRTVEYFTPVVTLEFRAMQPLTRVIWEAMHAAAARGLRRWNWGGTWASQQTLYTFKRRWGAVDRPYTYYTRLLNPRIRQATPAELLEQYPYFFDVPFNQLASA